MAYSQDPGPKATIPGDRRQPLARYVEFSDEATQEKFVNIAEDVYQDLVKADALEGMSQIEVQTGPAPAKKGLFRKAEAAPSHVITTTAALARVARISAEAPAEVHASPNNCAASVRVAQILANVATDLVKDLMGLEVGEQAEHGAYRQTLRLGAELAAVRDIVGEVPCTNPYGGCVAVRSPEAWGRRAEDVEVSEVREVLIQLVLAGKNLSGV